MRQPSKLMIPGPVDVWDETLAALGQQVLSVLTEDWRLIYEETIHYVQQIFQTQNDIFMLTATGSGAIETGVASLFTRGEKVAAVSNGPFALHVIEILRAYDCEVVVIENEWGCAADLDQVESTLNKHPDVAGLVVVANETGTGVRNPTRELAELAHARDIPILVDAVSGMGGYDLPMDRWGLDIVCTSSNKALEAPPGLGLIAVSQHAWKRIDAKQARGRATSGTGGSLWDGRGWYYDLSTWKRCRGQGRYSPATMATSTVMGLHASLKRMIEVETLEGHWARYAWAQKAVRVGLRNIGFAMLAPDEVASFTVSAVYKHPSMANAQELCDYLAAHHGFVVSTTWGKIGNKAFRVGHMGRSSSKEYLIPFLLGIEDFLRTEKGVAVPLGASLVGMALPGY